MEAYPCVTGLLPRNSVYQVVGGQYIVPVQQQQQQQPAPNPVQHEAPNKSNPTMEVFNDQIVHPIPNVSNIVGVVPINKQSQLSSDGNPPTARDAYVVNNNYYMQQPVTNVSSNVHGNGRLMTNNYVGQVHIMQVVPPNHPVPQAEQLNVNSNRTNATGNNFGQHYQQEESPDCHMKRMMKIPEPTQVKTLTDVREKIGCLKIQMSGSFLSWNVAERTVLDLNFMRNLFYIANVDIIFQPNVVYEAGVIEAVEKIVQNNLFSDWLVLKCEEKQIPFFKVKNQVEIYSVNNFSTLISIIAQESCLPLPFITRDSKNMKYFYINFPKSSKSRVKKLNVPIFHDADNGRKKIPCKYPGIRLDCNFESAVQLYVIHVQKSAVPAFKDCVTYLRQVIIYNHMVWGFLQAWTRKVREHYNGCFKMQEIAQNLSLCQSEASPVGKSPTDENELFYNIDYANFYLKFDPVTLRDTTVTFTIENFETNFVSDVSIVQYYRQFFLINDMHYSDALKNIVLFSEENGASNVTDFVYMPPKDDNIDRTHAGFSPPGGISRSSSQQQMHQVGKGPVKTNLPANLDVHSTKRIAQHVDPRMETPVSVSNGMKAQQRIPAPPANPPISKPLIKTRTVEEINSSVEMKKGLDGSQVSFDSILSNGRNVNEVNGPSLPSCIRETLNHCYVMNMAEIRSQDVSTDPKVLQQIFNEALYKAKEMGSIEGFIEKMYVSLQKYFTNATCQLIMNRTIRRALELRFPNLKPRLSGQTPVRKETPPSTGEATVVSQSQEIRKVNHCRNGWNVQAPRPEPPGRVISDKGNKNIPTISSQKKTLSKPKPESPLDPKTVEPATQDKNQDPQSLLMIGVSPILPRPPKRTSLKTSLKENSTPKMNNVTPTGNLEESSCSIDEGINEQQGETELGKSPKKVKDNLHKVNKGNESFTEASATVTETGNNISIKLTLPLSSSAEYTPKKSSPPISKPRKPVREDVNTRLKQVSPKKRKPGVEKKESRSGQETESVTKDLFVRYNIRPCSVVLNRHDVTSHQNNLQERLRKRRNKTIYTSTVVFSDDDLNDQSDDDFRDNDFVMPESKRAKRMKKVSDLQYMEARTIVLQRLRRRNKMYVLSDSGRKVYTSEELNQFVVESPRDSRSRQNPCLEDSQREEDPEEAKYRALYNECLTRKAMVVLVRLEDTPDYRKHMNNEGKWRVKKQADGRLTLTRDFGEEYENLPKNKRKYFELKDGKLYLKDQYQVKNGRIMPINPGMKKDIVNLKNEPVSVQDESDFTPSRVKQERSLE